LLTVFPDYLFRRYAQGKRIGREINLYTMCNELRWALPRAGADRFVDNPVFYYHPSTKNVSRSSARHHFRNHRPGCRVFVGVNGKVQSRDRCFGRQFRAGSGAGDGTGQIEEADAEATVAQTDWRPQMASSRGASAYQQALDELEMKPQL